MSGPEQIRSRGSWSHIVSLATDAMEVLDMES